MELKLGKTDPTPVGLKLSSFVNPSELPKPPRQFGHEAMVLPTSWGMLGNDRVGDCVIAAKMHIQMLMSALGGHKAPFDTKGAIDLYSTLTGYNPNDPYSDNGTNMKYAAGYWRNTGITDLNGRNHKIEAYLSFDPSNITELYQALYLFGAVDIGFQFPASAMDQFRQNKPWTVVEGSPIVGGHDVCIVAKRSALQCITWGKMQPMTAEFYGKYNDESFVYVSKDQLIHNKSREGFDSEGLINILNFLK